MQDLLRSFFLVLLSMKSQIILFIQETKGRTKAPEYKIHEFSTVKTRV